MKLKIAFYKKSKTLFGRLIVRQQRLYGIPERYARYSHVELVFEDWLSFSSSEIDWGVRFKKIEWKNENWDFIELEISKSKYRKILKFCMKQEGNGYNKIGIFFAQILNFRKTRKGDWFCSEIVTRALQEAQMLCTLTPLFTKPAELACKLERGEYIITDFIDEK